MVYNEDFKNLFQVTDPYYKIPSRSTVDILSNLLEVLVLNVAAHFGLGTEFQWVTLEVYQLHERYISKYIAKELLRTCNDWGFETDKVFAVVTDNAANMVKAIEIAFGK